MFKTRQADEHDYAFLFDLKKVAEYEPISAIFGWDDDVQKDIHQQEWEEAKPKIIEVEGVRVGSYLVQEFLDHLYFGRFFILPDCQGKGIGSLVLRQVIALSESKNLPIMLCYLKSNRVGSLYKRFDFKITMQDEQFVHMIRQLA